MSNLQFKSVKFFATVLPGERVMLEAFAVQPDGSVMELLGREALGFLLGFAVTYSGRQMDDTTAEETLRSAASAAGIPLPSWIKLPPESV